jgi:GT2 family glycosyltransferase
MMPNAGNIDTRLGDGPSPPTVAIIIPVFNKVELTRNCLASLAKHYPESISPEVVVFDNASSDGTSAYLAQAQLEYDWLKVIRSVKNLGFAGACNKSSQLSDADILVFLNNDTVVTPHWLEKMLERIHDDKVGMVGSKLLYPDGRIQHAGVVFDQTVSPIHIHRLAGQADPIVNRLWEYPAVTAACLMMKRSFFMEVGMMDLEYPFYYEDLDLCMKVRKSGYRILYQPESIVFHLEGQSTKTGEAYEKHMASKAIFVRKWMDYLAREIAADPAFYSAGRAYAIKNIPRADTPQRSDAIPVSPEAPRVLWQNRNDCFSFPGGDTTVVEETVANLNAMGVRTGVSLEDSPDLSGYDMVHLNNISRTRDTLEQVRNAKRRNLPTLLTPLYEDMDRYLVPATKWDMLFQRMAGTKTMLTLEEIQVVLSRFELPEHPLDDEVAKLLGIGNKGNQQEILSSVDCVLTSGPGESRTIVERFGKMRRLETVHFGFNRRFLEADGRAFSDKYGIKDFVLCVGRIEPRKNQWSLVEIFRTLPHLKLVLIGPFFNPQFATFAKAYAPKNVIFLERLPFDELVSAFGAARVHALPSWYELPGLVSLEAAAAGCRIVSTSWGTAVDYFQDRVTYCEPDDMIGIRKAILNAYDSHDDGGLRRFVGETYGWDKTARRLKEIYGSIA